MFAKRFSILLAAVLISASSAAIVFDLRFRDDRAAEALLCRLYLCANDLVLDHAYRGLWEGDAGGVDAAVEGFRESLRRNPASAQRWADLGEAFARQGNAENAAKCFEQAVERGPHSPPILLRAAHFHLSADEPKRALELFTRILALADDYDEVIFRRYSGEEFSLSGVLDHALPRDGLPGSAGTAERYQRFLERNGETEQAERVRQWRVGGVR